MAREIKFALRRKKQAAFGIENAISERDPPRRRMEWVITQPETTIIV